MHHNFIAYLNQLLSKQKETNPLIKQVSLGKGTVNTPLLRANQYMPVLVDAIKNAKTEVLYIGYKIDGGSDAEQSFIDALDALNETAQLNRQKINVRILLNLKTGIAAHFKPNPKKLTALRTKQYSSLDFQYVEHQHNSVGSYHMKQLIIDGHTAIICSGDLLIKNYYADGQRGWTEIANVIHATDIVQHIRTGFINAWNSTHSTPLENDKKSIVPSLQPTEEVEKNSNISNDSNSILYFSKKANGYLAKRNNLSPYIIAVIEAIEHANDSINIITPNLNVPEVINALAKANKRGVTINIITGKYHNDDTESKPFFGGTNQQGIQNLFSVIKQNGGQHMDKLNIKWVRDDKGTLVTNGHKQLLHAKLVIIDNNVVLAGSSVLDLQSAYHSAEGDFCIQSDRIAKEYSDTIFTPIFNEGIDLFDDKDNQLTTNSQDIIRELNNILHKNIETLIFKKETLSTNKITKHDAIDDVISAARSLQQNITTILAKKNKVSVQDVQTIIKNYQLWLIKLDETSITFDSYRETYGTIYTLKEIFSDGYKNFLSQNAADTAKDLSTKGMLDSLNQQSKQQLQIIIKSNPYYPFFKDKSLDTTIPTTYHSKLTL